MACRPGDYSNGPITAVPLDVSGNVSDGVLIADSSVKWDTLSLAMRSQTATNALSWLGKKASPPAPCARRMSTLGLASLRLWRKDRLRGRLHHGRENASVDNRAGLLRDVHDVCQVCAPVLSAPSLITINTFLSRLPFCNRSSAWMTAS